MGITSVHTMERCRHVTADQVRAFAAVAARASFSKAAEQLRISQSAVSKAVSEIEEAVGEALFSREYGQVRLTEAGATFLPLGLRLLAAYSDAESAIQRNRDSETTPTIRLCGSRSIMPVVMPTLAHVMFAEYKRPGLRFSSSTSEGVLSFVADGRSDFGITLVHQPVPATLRFEPLLSSPLGLVTSPNMPIPATISHLQDLEGLPLVRLPDTFAIAQVLAPFAHNLRNYFDSPRKASSVLSALSCIRAGSAATIASAAAASHPMASGLHFVSLGNLLTPIQIGLIIRCDDVFDAKLGNARLILRKAVLQSAWRGEVSRLA